MTAIPKVVASYATTLANKISSSATSMTLVTGTDDAGNSLSGTFGFVIDKGTASEEFVIGSVSGTAVTSMTRGLDPQNPSTEVSALKKEHRRGATVEITDYPVLGRLARILNGDDTIPNRLAYASEPTWTSGSSQLATVKKVEDTANAGAADASTTVKGIAEEATQAEVDADTAAGGTSARLFVNPSTLATSKYGTQLPSSGQKSALAGSSGTPGSGNKYITEDDVSSAAASGKIVRATGTALPALSGANLTNLPTLTFKSGVTTYDLSTASGNQTIAHGLSATPKYVRFIVTVNSTAIMGRSEGVYNGTNNTCIYAVQNGGTGSNDGTESAKCIHIAENDSDTNKQTATATVDGTNITLAWTKTGTPSQAANIHWEAYA